MANGPGPQESVAGAKDHEEAVSDRRTCGLVMPIAEYDGCSADHWLAVNDILSEGIAEAGFTARLVSQDTTSGVIHQRIIANLYRDPIIVCDVSGRNPNVMFELGMRLAFDKPTVIVKDDATPFSFDIAGIEHLTYPRSLRYADILSFKSKLAEFVRSTSELALKDPEYSTFLKHMSGMIPSKLELKEVPYSDFVQNRLDEIIEKLNTIDDERSTRTRSLRISPMSVFTPKDTIGQSVFFEVGSDSQEKLQVFAELVRRSPVILYVNHNIREGFYSGRAVARVGMLSTLPNMIADLAREAGIETPEPVIYEVGPQAIIGTREAAGFTKLQIA